MNHESGICVRIWCCTEMRKSRGEWEESSAIKKKVSAICGLRQITQAFHQGVECCEQIMKQMELK